MLKCVKTQWMQSLRIRVSNSCCNARRLSLESLESIVIPIKREKLQDNIGFKTARQSKHFSVCVLGSIGVWNPMKISP